MIYKLDLDKATPHPTGRGRSISGWFSAAHSASKVVSAGPNLQSTREGGTQAGRGMFGLLVSSHVRGRWF